LAAGSLQALGRAASVALAWNQDWVPLVRPVTVQLEASRRSIHPPSAKYKRARPKANSYQYQGSFSGKHLE